MSRDTIQRLLPSVPGLDFDEYTRALSGIRYQQHRGGQQRGSLEVPGTSLVGGIPEDAEEAID